MTSTASRTRRPARTVPGHRITWYVYAGGYGQPLVKMRKTSTMRGTWPGYDFECECGHESRTGGAVKSYVEGLVRDHKFEVTDDIAHLGRP